MTKNRSMKIAVLVLALALLTSCFVGSTFAKYTSSATGTSNGAVAKWDFTVNTADIDDPAVNTFNFNLMETIYEIDSTDADDEVLAGQVAPGTEGKFDIVLTNNSEVDATYAIDFTVGAGVPTNLKFATKVGAGEKSAYGTLDDIAATDIEMSGGTTTVTVFWQWVFETDGDSDASNGISGDVDDTADGRNDGAFTVTAQVTATQKN